ncbi:YphA family membrane protein [Halalkalibacterium halodurans]|uniref:BH1637 protein n=1 Tax=Halalkalibacterium halodurans (strain ATCC BAA-125 / DSM 18197 / FERM 7344 / JCM 9153 / C-125) TaxID=272558 RepID=Q9KCD5_HALH5|nr:hypothetical protein [Halalkalibacterium halodurans]MDY7222209.1 hypothetical protein [Halalkalibacterium halodurans]MDY7241430.1 hypothetical protein [Halalkalibacterium halodurans]MED4123841.1 hypothetical protein [Halalkalibacterium halodurans]MED4173077.1 hypothetical protein [Halalkalibacterium halodurans]BAB05356.1 BH1637 [Halalkalibacterium halodurans C-125]
MSGGYFFWFAWTSWIVITFFVPKSKVRTKLAVVLLLLIIMSGIQFTIGGQAINASVIFLQMIGYFLVRRSKGTTLLYVCMGTWVIAAAYAGFHFIEVFDPVVLIVDRIWLLGPIIAVLVLLLAVDRRKRFSFVILGFTHGEWLVTFGFRHSYHPVELGSFASLDVFMVSSFLIACWSALEWLATWIASITDRRKQTSSHPSAS